MFHRNDMILLKDLKVGSKFFEANYRNPLIYVLMELTIDPQKPNAIEYHRRKLKSNEIEVIKVGGMNVLNTYHVFKFTHRDRSSFVAGFQACMRLYHDNVDAKTKAQIGLQNDLSSYMLMNREYQNWKINIDSNGQ